MANSIDSVINISGSDWAKDLTARYPDAVKYVLKHGSPIEKALVEHVVRVSRG
ncbi:MAG: hypothetical protein JXA38_04040 [Methanosarcinaceae archaeon]|nr:hypothetical protein [Methanosarcinaceae archaeon]